MLKINFQAAGHGTISRRNWPFFSCLKLVLASSEIWDQRLHKIHFLILQTFEVIYTKCQAHWPLPKFRQAFMFRIYKEKLSLIFFLFLLIQAKYFQREFARLVPLGAACYLYIWVVSTDCSHCGRNKCQWEGCLCGVSWFSLSV